jgi:hypothetical protein
VNVGCVGCVVGRVVGRVVGHVVVVVDVGASVDVARREQSSCSEKTQKTRVRLCGLVVFADDIVRLEFIWFTFETFRADTMGLEG